jgi:hypothetical protein
MGRKSSEEMRTAPPGAGKLRLILDHFFADFMLPQYESVEETLREFPADIIIGDH